MTSLIQGMTVAENLCLRDVARPPYSTGPWLNTFATEEAARRLIIHYAIRAAGPKALACELSGGNQQKIVVAREIDRAPRVLIAFQATWGLDPGATRFVSEQVIALRNAGNAILYVSADLDEVLTLGDRIAVMFNGRIVEIVPRDEVDLERIGLLMAGRSPANGHALEPDA
jgi:simple sugar transport system ATP-binding protein